MISQLLVILELISKLQHFVYSIGHEHYPYENKNYMQKEV